MQCIEVTPELGAWLDGELPPAVGVQLEEHVLECSTCAAEADTLRRLQKELRRLPSPVVRGASSLVDRLVDEPDPVWRKATRRVAGLAALVGLALAGSVAACRLVAPPAVQHPVAPAAIRHSIEGGRP